MITIIVGCKENKAENFKYEYSDRKLCALKSNHIKSANEFGMLDSSFKYKEILENLSNKNSHYIFCFDISKVKSDSLETQIRLEIKKGKYLRQYEFINYSCLSTQHTRLNLSKSEMMKICG
ncbi:hypothetical protein F2A31_04405 [Acinetobacter suaedae]|uniref:Uncharacterized protein n=1 Tax=Acinetobacter suaedae TaxID=2609668 RepID=A0A5P1UPZ2_9GAMM|nr:hypothetical protein [Acinetobacter sp. C16S1]QER38981.1 hypothetical protein F2A31_04405 [Acinetobacter sp. C16S1]